MKTANVIDQSDLLDSNHSPDSRRESRRLQFISLVDRGFSEPDYLAREVFPEIYEAMPALAVTEAKEYLERYRSGELQKSAANGDRFYDRFPVEEIGKTIAEVTVPKPGVLKMAKSVKGIGVPSAKVEGKKSNGKKSRPSREKAAKPPTPKQKSIPGMEPETIPAIEKAAEEYADVRDERMALTEQETELQAKLVEIMQKHGQTTYKYEGSNGKKRIVYIVGGDAKAKVKNEKDKTPKD